MYKGIITLNNGTFTLPLSVSVLYTLSTINGTKGEYEAPPDSMPFPLPYEDNFNRYSISSEAAFFADQAGSWEIVDTFSSRGKVMRQMVTEIPISWCISTSAEAPYPYSVIGDSHWQQPLTISADIMIESAGAAFVAIGVSRGSCDASIVGSSAIVFSVNTTNNGTWQLTNSTAFINPLDHGNVSIISGTWYTIRLSVLSDHSEAYINGNFVGRCQLNATSFSGLVAIGSSWDYVQFDNFRLQSPKESVHA
jgi:galactosylceramidase